MELCLDQVILGIESLTRKSLPQLWAGLKFNLSKAGIMVCRGEYLINSLQG